MKNKCGKNDNSNYTRNACRVGKKKCEKRAQFQAIICKSYKFTFNILH